MTKIHLFLIVSTIFSNTLFAGIFDNEIKVKLEYCENKDVFIVYTYSVDKEANKVFEKREIFSEKKLKKTELTKLENCSILNKNNWKCGGERTYFTDQRNGIFKTRVDEINQVVDGRFSRDEYHFEFNGERENLTNICYKIKQY